MHGLGNHAAELEKKDITSILKASHSILQLYTYISDWTRRHSGQVSGSIILPLQSPRCLFWFNISASFPYVDSNKPAMSCCA
jgi:hypothetical protein